MLSTCKNSLDTAKKAGLGRYTAVNLMPENTIEFRIFRGTLRYETFMATIEFTHYLCELARKLSDENFHAQLVGVRERDRYRGISGTDRLLKAETAVYK